MKFEAIFDHVVVINLLERRDRMLRVADQLTRLGAPIGGPVCERFEAIRPVEREGFPSIGARGCFLSHLNVLRRAYDEGWERILVLEDDVAFSPSFLKDPSPWLEFLDRSYWDWCYFGGRYEPSSGCGLFTEHNEAVECTHAYALNRAAIVPLLQYLSSILEREPGHPAGGQMHVDGAYSMYRERSLGRLKTIVATPGVAKQFSSRSDIAPSRFFDRYPVLREASTLMRKLKSSILRNEG